MTTTTGGNFGSALDSANFTNLEEMKEDDDADHNDNVNNNNNIVNNVNIDDYDCFGSSKVADDIFTLLINYLNKLYENLLQPEDKCFSVPLFLDDNNYYENSPMHKQQMLLGNK